MSLASQASHPDIAWSVKVRCRTGTTLYHFFKPHVSFPHTSILSRVGTHLLKQNHVKYCMCPVLSRAKRSLNHPFKIKAQLIVFSAPESPPILYTTETVASRVSPFLYTTTNFSSLFFLTTEVQCNNEIHLGNTMVFQVKNKSFFWGFWAEEQPWRNTRCHKQNEIHQSQTPGKFQLP